MFKKIQVALIAFLSGFVSVGALAQVLNQSYFAEAEKDTMLITPVASKPKTTSSNQSKPVKNSEQFIARSNNKTSNFKLPDFAVGTNVKLRQPTGGAKYDFKTTAPKMYANTPKRNVLLRQPESRRPAEQEVKITAPAEKPAEVIVKVIEEEVTAKPVASTPAEPAATSSPVVLSAPQEEAKITPATPKEEVSATPVVEPVTTEMEPTSASVPSSKNEPAIPSEELSLGSPKVSLSANPGEVIVGTTRVQTLQRSFREVMERMLERQQEYSASAVSAGEANVSAAAESFEVDGVTFKPELSDPELNIDTMSSEEKPAEEVGRTNENEADRLEITFEPTQKDLVIAQIAVIEEYGKRLVGSGKTIRIKSYFDANADDMAQARQAAFDRLLKVRELFASTGIEKDLLDTEPLEGSLEKANTIRIITTSK